MHDIIDIIVQKGRKRKRKNKNMKKREREKARNGGLRVERGKQERTMGGGCSSFLPAALAFAWQPKGVAITQ